MAKKKATGPKDSKNTGFIEVCGGILSSVLGFSILLNFAFFSLVYDDYYFNILETKLGFFRSCAMGMLIISGVLIFVFMFIDFVEFKGNNTLNMLKRLLPANWKQTFTVADVAVMMYLLIHVLSAYQSDYREAAITGDNGRFTGLQLNFLYVAVYFLISRCWKVKNWFFEVFLVNGMLVCLLGITDYFQLDLLHFRDRISPGQATIFMSTIGNINTYTAYVALVMGFAAAMFMGSEEKRRSIWYFVCMVISFFAIIMGRSENAYLAIGALFAFSPLYLFLKREGIGRYLMMLASFFTVISVIALLNHLFPQQVCGLDGLFEVIARARYLVFLVVMLWIVTGAFITYCKNNADEQEYGNKTFYWVWCVLLGCGFAALLYGLYDVNVAGNAERYGSLGGYLLFNDGWGTNRGYIWRKAAETYQAFPVVRKLVGYGPDTFGFLTEQFYTEMVNVTGQNFDSAHNEYLQFLVTIGLLGLISYLVFLASLCQQMLKAGKENLYVRGIVWAVICYLFQAIVNINLPVVTPMLWLLMSCGMAICRGQKASA